MKLDSVSREYRRRLAKSPDITVDVVAFAKSLGITNKMWIADIRAGMKRAMLNAPMSTLPSVHASPTAMCSLFCEEIGYKLARHLMSQPDFRQGMTVIRSTPRVKKA
jgi:hypothetical protein